MQIPGVQSFGTNVAPAPQTAAVPDLSTGQGAAAVGQAIQGIGSEERERQQAMQRGQAALALAKTSNAFADAHDAVAQGVQDGSIPSDQAAAKFQTLTDQARSDNLSGIRPEQQDAVDAQLLSTQGHLARSLNGVVIKRQQSETGAVIDQFGEQVSRQSAQLGPQAAVDKYGAMVDFTGSAAGWTPEQMAAKKQTFAEKTTFSFFDGAGTDALTKGDVNGVSAVLAKVQGPDGDALDPKNRAQLTHQLYGYQQHLIAKNAAQANAVAEAQRVRDNAGVDFFNKGTDIMLKGGVFSADFIKDGSAATVGTSSEKDWTALMGAQSLGTGFATRPLAEQKATLTQLEASRADPASGTDPAKDKAIDLLRTIYTRGAAQAESNPWNAAASIGKIPAVTSITAAASPQQAEQVIADRMKTIGVVENYVGHKVSPLQPEETEQIGKLIRTLPYDQAARTLADMGATIGDSDRVASVAKQLGDKDGTLGLSMAFANTGTTQGRLVAELLMRGEQSLKDRSTMIDQAAQTGWKASIANAIDGAYSNREVEDQTKRAAYLVMAARANDSTQKDTSLEKAVQLVTGGIIERNGQKVPMPYGMKDEDAFNKAVEAIKPADLAAQAPGGNVRIGGTSMPLDAFTATLPKATLIHAGQGLYNVKAGPYLATNANGQRITLRIAP